MPTLLRRLFNLFLLSSVSLTLINCGGGGGGGGVPAPAAEIKEGTITGISSLGPINGGDVVAYDFSNGDAGVILNPTTAKTAVDGVYSITLKMKNKPILVCIESGDYIEAASLLKKKINFNSFDKLCAVANYKQNIPQNISITYFTHLAYGYASRLIEQGVAISTAINQANNALSTWISVDVVSTIPINVTNVTSQSRKLTNRHKYGFANAALSSVIKELSVITGVQNEFASITSISFSQSAFLDVLNDGRLNGKSDTGVVDIGTVQITKNIYRDKLAQNILTMAASTRNESSITKNNVDLIVYSESIRNYTGSIFKPITGPVIQITSSNELNLLTGMVTVSATVTDTIKLESVNISLINESGVITPLTTKILTTNSSGTLINASATFDSNNFTDGIYSLKVDAVNINSETTTKKKNNLNINNSGVAGTNVAPIAKPDIYKLTLGGPKPTFMVLDNDIDPDKGPNLALEVVLDTTSPTVKGAIIAVNTAKTGITYTASSTMAVNDVDVLTYRAFDGLDNSKSVIVTVTATNQTNRDPVAQPLTTTAVAGTEIVIQLPGNDPDNDQLSVIIDSRPNNGSVSPGPGQAITYTAAVAGNTSLTYHFVDGRGGISNTETVTITVSPPENTPPEIIFDTILVNGLLAKWYQSPSNFQAFGYVNDSAIGLSKLEHSIGSSAFKLVPGAISGTPLSYRFSIPTTGFTVPSDGRYTYTLRATDAGNLSTTATLTNIGFDSLPPTINIGLAGSLPVYPTGGGTSITVPPQTSSSFPLKILISDPGMPATGSGLSRAAYSSTSSLVNTNPAMTVQNGVVINNSTNVYNFKTPIIGISAVYFGGMIEKQKIFNVTSGCEMSNPSSRQYLTSASTNISVTPGIGVSPSLGGTATTPVLHYGVISAAQAGLVYKISEIKAGRGTVGPVTKPGIPVCYYTWSVTNPVGTINNTPPNPVNVAVYSDDVSFYPAFFYNWVPSATPESFVVQSVDNLTNKAPNIRGTLLTVRAYDNSFNNVGTHETIKKYCMKTTYTNNFATTSSIYYANNEITSTGLTAKAYTYLQKFGFSNISTPANSSPKTQGISCRPVPGTAGFAGTPTSCLLRTAPKSVALHENNAFVGTLGSPDSGIRNAYSVKYETFPDQVACP